METKFCLKSILLILLWKLLTVQCEELVAIIAPKTIYRNSVFNAVIQTKGVERKAELAIQFQKSNRTYFLENNNTYPFQYSSNGTIRGKYLNLTSTLYREKSKGLDIVQQCSTKTIEIKIDKPIFYIFIQTDKPIYNPREDVQFRVIVVDKDLKPHQINNIDIEIVDPLNRTIERFTDLDEDKNMGIYVEKFTIGKNPLYGEWKITVNVEKQKNLIASKSFSVQKFDLPLFGVKIETSAKDYVVESILAITFDAGYAFGTSVAGNAELIIQDIADDQIYFAKRYDNVHGREDVTINMKIDFTPQIYKRVDLRATLMFTEFESGLVYNKSTEFTVHADSSTKITPVHLKEFTPGFPFDFKVFVQNWKNETVNTYDEVEMDYIFKLIDGTRKKITFHPLLDNGTAEQYMTVPQDAIEFDIQCRFLNSRVYRVKVGMANPDRESKKLEIEYEPKNPQLTHTVNFFVKSEKFLGRIIIAIMTKYGNINTQAIDCNNKIICYFDVEVLKEMTPKFTVEVYHVRHKDAVDFGSVEISTGNIGINYLTMKLSNRTVEPKENVTMTFETTRNSRIFLLAVDKRIKFINDANDLRRNDIMNKVGRFDTQNVVLVDDMTDWHPCTTEELLRMENGRRTVRSHSAYGYHNYEEDNEQDSSDDELSVDDDEFGDDEGEKPKVEQEQEEPIDIKDLREHFPQTWLFETIKSSNTTTAITYKVPHSITSWYISAFSVHDERGLGIMKPHELKVKRDFFIKFNLPYSLRYTEILKVDVLVFNYNKNNKPANATIKMLNLNSEMFEFVEYVNCTPTFNTNRHTTKVVKVPAHDMKRVSFYIRSRPEDTDFSVEKKITIRVLAKAKDTTNAEYKDLIQKQLTIENFGVKLVDIDSVAYTLNGNRNGSVFQTNSNESYTNSYCIVTGDYLSEKINLNSEFEHQSSDLLEHKVAKLKWNINVHQYFKSKGTTKDTKYFKQEYQDVLALQEINRDNGTSTGLTAFIVETLVSLMDQKLTYEDPDVIENELNILKSEQLETGEFKNFGSIPEYNKDSANYNVTKKYFETAYILISFLKADEIVEHKFTDVIDKALEFLEKGSTSYENQNEATSIIAYAYSIKAPTDSIYVIKTKSLIDSFERTLIDYGGKEMCVKIKSTDENCNLRHTAYAAMAYLNLNQTHKAVPLVYWLLKSYNFNVLDGNFYDAAIMSEPITKVANLIKSDKTDVTVILNDEYNFENSLKIVEGNSTDFYMVNFPRHSKILNSTVFGHGFVSITKIIERTLNFAVAIEPTFNITIDILKNKTITKSGETVIHVCAEFDKEKWNLHEMGHVVYEIHMPSGYIFDEIIDLENMKKDIRLVKEGRKKTFIIIYFMDFQGSTQYCVDIRAVKMFDVKNPLKSSVKVFNYDEKKKFGLAFYELPMEEWC